MRIGKLMLVLFCAFPLISEGQNLVVSDSNDSRIELKLDGLQEVSLSDSTLQVKYSDGNSQSYTVSSVDNIKFEGPSGEDMVSAMDGKVVYDGNDGLLIVAGAKDKHLLVYSLGGTQVLDRKVESQIETVSLESLPKGVYLLKLDGKTIKIVR